MTVNICVYDKQMLENMLGVRDAGDKPCGLR
jgi:hypothetical protein